MFLYVTTTLISVAAIDRLVVRPIFGTFNSLDKQIEDLQLQIRRSVRIVADRQRISTLAEQYSGYSVEEKSPEKEKASLLKYIEELASQATVNLIYVKPAGEKVEGREKKYLITLECEGKMDQLTTFFYNLESSTQSLKIEKYTIQPVEAGSSVGRAAVTISKTVVP